MSTIRPSIVTTTEAQSYQMRQGQSQTTSVHDAQFYRDLNSKTSPHSTNSQEHLHSSSKSDLTASHFSKHQAPLSSHKSVEKEDETLKFYMQKESKASSLKNKHSVTTKDDSSEDESDDAVSEGGGSDDEWHRPTHQSLISQAGQAIGLGLKAISNTSDDEETDASIFSQGTFQGGSKQSASNLEENNSLGVALTSANRSTLANFEQETALGAPSALQQGAPKSVAVALRATRFSDSLLNELTASVQSLRLNTANGQDMTLTLRSDVLEATSIHITGSGAHLAVEFSTTNALSNELLNSHMALLQNHLTILCPGQVVDVRNQFVAQAGLRDLNNGSGNDRSQDDLASFDQGNRGNRGSHNDDGLL